jgi:periplasmic protein TonB
VAFIVEPDGRLTNLEVIRSLGFGCDEEATRVIRAMPAWRPGKQSGRAVRVRYNLPISFALE